MKKFLLILLVFDLIGCDENIRVDLLKSDGYIETSCTEVKRYDEENLRFLEINKDLSVEKDFILARCFNNNSCIFDVKYEEKTITCQRYILNKQERNFSLNIEHKEYLDHRVLYFLLTKRKVLQ